MKSPFSIFEKHVAIFGAGRSGRAAAALALREGAVVSIWDQGGEEVFAKIPAGVETHPNWCQDDAEDFSADLIVISPGIDTYSPLVEAFSAKAPLIGETELASHFFDGGIIGITGTNGKTTTTELVSLILKHAGLGGTPCGNYGAPLSEILLEPDIPAAIALELSSFQLETIDDLRPKVSIWLNFAPDHMDRYPSVEAYKNAKLQIFKNQTKDDTVVVRFGEELGDLVPKVITFSTETREADFYSDGITIMQGGRILLDLESETSLRGLHNAENAMAAMAACMAYGIDPSIIPAALQGYAPPPHRCELIRTLDGVEYLNDSKATNLHALQCALRSQNRPVVLIAGGKEKGLDYSPLLPVLKKQSIGAVTFGQISRPLAELFNSVVPTSSVATLEEAIQTARSIAPRGSTILLSPGTSSFDQFKGYEHRGDVFRDLVHQLF
ncbi:UDP-N-acetylmuramoyl-L-alanine--D-glutamate ligase [Luteolibacter algae]|uniref:UDP-N-acetylmuramoylalanine--D-glutamate ligase n=1 Tax=Luteolibacter algae TaxID=454151 RepID=A0ABW5DAB3_9BACT